MLQKIHRTYRLTRWMFQLLFRLLDFKVRTLKYVSAFVLLLLVILQLASVQTYLLQKTVLPPLSEALGFPVKVEYLQLDLFGRLELRGFALLDEDSASFIEADSAHFYFSLKKLLQRPIVIDSAFLFQPNVQMRTRTSDTTQNMTRFVEAIDALLPPSEGPRKPGVSFRIEKISLQNGSYTLENNTKDFLPEKQFDYNHFTFQNIFTKVHNLEIIQDTVQMYFEHLTGQEKQTCWPIHHLHGEFQYSKKSMHLRQMEAFLGESMLSDSLAFYYDSPTAFSSFADSVQLGANLTNTRLSSKDLALFAPTLETYEETVQLEGLVAGNLQDLKVRDFRINAEGRNEFAGNVQLKNLTQPEKLDIALDLTESKLNFADLKKYLPEDLALLEKLGDIRFKGLFEGEPKHFHAAGLFSTALGEVESDLRLDVEKRKYKGTVSLDSFRLGQWVGIPDVGHVSMTGEIEGKGFTRSDANFTLNAKISHIKYQNYTYRNIVTDGRFRENFFDGLVVINDPNLSLKTVGTIDLKDSLLNLTGTLKNSDFQALGFTTETLKVKTAFDGKIKGLKLEDFTGNASLFNLDVQWKDKSFSLAEFHFKDSIYEENSCMRHLTLDSDLLSGYVHGCFDYKSLPTHWGRLAGGLVQHFSLRDSARALWYENLEKSILKSPPTEDNYQFELNLHHLNPVLNLADTALRLADEARLSGVFHYDTAQHLRLFFSADSLHYAGNVLHGAVFNADINKKLEANALEGQITLDSEKQSFANFIEAETLRLEAELKPKGTSFWAKIEHQNSMDSLGFSGEALWLDTSVLVNLHPPALRLGKYTWRGYENVTLVYKQGELHFQDGLRLQSGEQLVRIGGALTDDPKVKFWVDIENFNLSFFDELSGFELGGVADLSAEMLAPLSKKRSLDSRVSARDITINGTNFGEFTGYTAWQPNDAQILVSGSARREDKTYLSLGGYILRQEKQDSLHVDIKVLEAPLLLTSPVLEGIVSELEGSLEGTIALRGRPGKPTFSGWLDVEDGSFMVDYLKTRYRFAHSVLLSDKEITVKRLRLMDAKNNFAFVEGGIYHDMFKDFYLELTGDMYKFQVLNTQEKDNSSFYGTANATGHMEFYGPFQQMNLQVDARSDAGTKVFVPLDTYEGLEERPFIRYRDPYFVEDSTTRKKEITPAENSSLRMNFNLDITQDAHAEIIFDKKAGDIIRGAGEGKIKMFMDSEGEFNMFGKVNILQGAYNFTFLNVINKKFNVNPGSSITWDGDPYDAQMDIHATYRQRASLAPIISQDTALLNQPEVRRKYPVEVGLFLRGGLMSPQINFDIDVHNYPNTINAGGVPISLAGNVAAFKRRLENDEQELNRQVFSLIVLRRLAAANTFQGINQTAGSSVSELLTNQLSYWFSQVDENLEIDLDLNGLDQEALNAMQLRLSYAFMNGRFRVTREGTFTNVQNETNLASIAGDWTLEYLITPDGRLRARAYHRNNPDAYSPALQNTSTTGASLRYTVTFDKVKEIFINELKNLQKKRNEQQIIDNEILRENP